MTRRRGGRGILAAFSIIPSPKILLGNSLFPRGGEDRLWVWEVEEQEAGGAGGMLLPQLPAFPKTSQAHCHLHRRTPNRETLWEFPTPGEAQLWSTINVYVPVTAYISKLFSCMCQLLIWITTNTLSKLLLLSSLGYLKNQGILALYQSNQAHTEELVSITGAHLSASDVKGMQQFCISQCSAVSPQVHLGLSALRREFTSAWGEVFNEPLFELVCLFP